MVTKRGQVDRTYRPARRLFSIAVTALAAVVVGMVVWPAARTHYYSARIDSDDPAVRARALEAVLPHAATDESLQRRLLEALTTLARSDDGIGPAQARAAAGWLFRNAPPFTQLAESRLAAAGDDAFPDLVKLMILGGRWDAASRSADQRARWLIHRYGTTQGIDRADVVRDMSEPGRAVARQLRPVLESALADPDHRVRKAAVESVAILLCQDAIDLLVRAADDVEPANRRATVLMLAAVKAGPRALPTVTQRLSDPEPAVRQAAAWAAAALSAETQLPPTSRQRLVEMLAKDRSDRVRAMTAVAVRDNDRLIEHFHRSQDIAARARCLRSLRPPLSQDHWDVVLGVLESGRKYWVVAAAAAAVGRCAPQPIPPRFRQGLLRRLEQALQQNEDGLAAACLRSLGRSGDRSVMGLLRDVTTKLSSRPWAALAAARAAARIDPAEGMRSLVSMLECPNDAVRDLAAFELARLPESHRPRAELHRALHSPNEPLRSGAVFALALIGDRAAGPEVDVLEYVRQRTDPASQYLETRLPLRAYYLAGRFMMGDASVRTDVRTLMASGQLPPTAACLALMTVNDPSGLDGPLLDNTLMPPGFAARTFLCDDRFGDVLADVLPDAPHVDWRADPDLQAWQIDRLRAWWRVHRAGPPWAR